MQSEDQALPHRFGWLMVALTMLTACGSHFAVHEARSARVDLRPVESVVAYHQFAVWADTIHQAELDQFFAGVGLERFVESLPTDPPPAPMLIATTGPHSYAWWEAIATCESGNTNAPRTGFYGLESDHPVGGLSKADQLAWAEQIDATSGDGAWGCAPVAWQNVPGG